MRFRPNISVDIPEGWAFKEQLTLHGSPEDDQVRLNVIASSEPIPAGFDSRQYAETNEEELRKRFPAFNRLGLEEMSVFGGRPGWMLRFEWEPEVDQRITQIQVYCVVDGRGYTATATAESEDFAQHQTELVSVLNSLAIDGGPSGGSAP